MKTALVCIAKNEDHYIDEWIQYHAKRGFSEIFVFQNNWRYAGDKCQYSNVHWIELDGLIKQLLSYQHFLNNFSSRFDFAAFFDVDEYLVLDKDPPLDEWLSRYGAYNAVGVNWRLFGDSGLSEPKDDWSCIRRFTHADKCLNRHIKTIINLKKCRADGYSTQQLRFIEPHSLSIARRKDFTVSTDKTRFIHGPFNVGYAASDQLNHYYCKTIKEFIDIKQPRGYPDQKGKCARGFYDHNKNDIEDLRAKTFFFS